MTRPRRTRRTDPFWDHRDVVGGLWATPAWSQNDVIGGTA